MPLVTPLRAMLDFEMKFSISYPAATNTLTVIGRSLTHNTITPPETLEIIIKVVSPTGQVIYLNAGYNTNNYTVNNVSINQTFALPTVSGGAPQEGNYRIYIRAKYYDGVNVKLTEEKVIQSAELILETVKPKVKLTYDCNNTTIRATNNSDLSTSVYEYISNASSITVTPPEVAAQSPVTGSGSYVQLSNLWQGAPYQAILEMTTQYRALTTQPPATVSQPGGATPDYYSYFEFVTTASDSETPACEDVMCKLYCCLTKLRKDYYGLACDNPSQSGTAYLRFVLGTIEYQMAVQARGCGGSIEEYVKKFYAVTGCKEECDCSDHDGASPVIGTGCDCEDGRNAEFRVNGSQLEWRLVGDVSWIVLFDFSTLTGATGAQGDPGVAIIWNDLAEVVSNASAQPSGVLKTWTIPANTLTTNGDEMIITAAFKVAHNANIKQVRLEVGGFGAGYTLFTANNSGFDDKLFIEAIVSRIDGTHMQVAVKEYHGGLPGDIQLSSERWTTNFAATMVINAFYVGDDGDITALQLKVQKVKKV